MPHRESIPYGYPDRPPTRILPPSYQPELVPMRGGGGPTTHSNHLRRNRLAPPPPPPPPVEYYSYGQPNHCKFVRSNRSLIIEIFFQHMNNHHRESHLIIDNRIIHKIIPHGKTIHPESISNR